MGSGPVRERPTLPNKSEDVISRPAPRGYAAEGMFAKTDDILIIVRVSQVGEIARLEKHRNCDSRWRTIKEYGCKGLALRCGVLTNGHWPCTAECSK